MPHWFLWPLLALPFGGGAPPRVESTPPPNVRELIARTSTVYRNAASGVSVIATVHQEGYFGERRRIGDHRIRVVRSETASLFEFLQTKYKWIADSNMALSWAPDENSYFVTAEDGHDRKIIVGQIDHWCRRVWGRFAILSKLEAEFQYVRMETLKVKGQPIRCAVVAVRPDDPAEIWRDQLWIELETGLIWKSTMRWPLAKGFMASIQTTTWEEIRIGPPPADFSDFTPPKGSRPLDRLWRPPQVDPSVFSAAH